MIGLLQRVSQGWVDIDDERVGEIGQGLVVLVGVEPEDTVDLACALIDRILRYRVFSDDAGKMNLSLVDVNGGILLVPQFTLAADTTRGRRPSFSTAAPPELGKALFEVAVDHAIRHHDPVQCGRFGADMKVGLVNNGPVTFWLHVR